MNILRVTKEQTRWISSTEQVVLEDVLSQCQMRTTIKNLSIFYGYSLVADEDYYINPIVLQLSVGKSPLV